MQDLKEIKDTKDNTAKDKDEILNTAWNIINDTYRTDIPLLYPPHMIAIAAMHMASVSAGKDFKQWFAELNVDLDKVQLFVRWKFQASLTLCNI